MNAQATRDLGPHLTERDIRILEDLEQFRLLTTRQLQRLHLPARPFGDHATASAATRGTSRILNRLEGLGAVARLERRIGGIKHGSALTIWHLGAAGERYLRARRGDPTRRRYTEPSLSFTAHTLAVADIAVMLREQVSIDSFELLDLEVESACWRTFNSTGTDAITLRPDLLVVTADTETETHSFVEVDLGTEHTNAVLRKCRTYQQYQRTGTEQTTRGLFPAVVWIIPTRKRAVALRDAIRAERTLDPDLFWVITPDAMLRHLAPYNATVTT
ncbi:replication-relaxation family protein [Agromyces tropicus]|uniref:Replication-relaxation family protein n=1 Tax=Agromyces tropicus TaxID=555371 RepID=A0ABN2TV44_9MICO